MSRRSRGLGIVAITISIAVVVFSSMSAAAGAKSKTTIWAPTLRGLQKQVVLKGDLLASQEETITDPSDCFVFPAGARVKLTFSFTPRKSEARMKILLLTINSKPSRSSWRRDLKHGKELTLRWRQRPKLGKHGEKDAIKLSIYNQHGVHITSVAPARWYLYKAGTPGGENCSKAHPSP